MKKIATLFIALFAVIGLMAQSSQALWNDLTTTDALLGNEVKNYLPTSDVRTLSLDNEGMNAFLKKAPQEMTEAATKKPLELYLPTPEGSMAGFGIYEIHIMAPGLAAKYPSIKTYAGNSLDQNGSFVRITTGPLGFHATIYDGRTHDIIESVTLGEASKYISYNLEDAANHGPVKCGNHDVEEENDVVVESMHESHQEQVVKAGGDPVNLRTFRLAMATTVEYSIQNGGAQNDTADVLNAVTSVINQVNGIFEKQSAIRFEMIDGTTQTFHFGDADLDPYTNGDAGLMIQQNPPVLNSAYGEDAFDIGHVFGRALGAGTVGLAALASVCGDNKARGISNTLGPNFFMTVTHEFGHSFNATHTFNNCDSENENPGTGYEPGGGTTIMAYAGACTTNSVQGDADPYFHINSLERILAFSTGSQASQCAAIIATDNHTPEAAILDVAGLVIPISTPFELRGEATDSDNDMLVYTWEQYDIGPASPLGSPSMIGTPPLFRSWPPSNNPTRVFPRIQTIVANNSSDAEILPTTSRELTFRFTARDNNDEAGGHDFDEIVFNSTTSAGPFLVTAPNTGSEEYTVGDYVEVTWDVANTDGNAVNCQNVDIYLSIDGGFTYPMMLLEGTKNDGSAFVVIPDAVTNLGRIKVKASNNIFFDISNSSFNIIEATDADFTVSNYSPEFVETCLPNSFTVELTTAALAGFTEMITFSAVDLPAGATADFSVNPIAVGETATMTVNMDASVADGEYDITVIATANGADNEERIVTVNAVNSDFSALTLDAPSGSAISSLPVYEWADLANASSYAIEVATDPNFTNIIDTGSDLDVTTYTSSTTLEENTIYFWRVRPTNECGEGDFTDAGAFRTISQSCTIYPSTGSVAIPNGNGSIVSSVINVSTGGDISDVNVKNIAGEYDAFGDIVFRLSSPTATVNLMNQQPCANPSGFNLGFDDESPITDIPCPPPSDGANYKPVGSLSDFIGEDSQGDWALEVEVVTNFGAGGSIGSWDLEICGSFIAQDPFLVTNEPLALPPMATYNIFADHLTVEDNDDGPNSLKFTILKNTDAGFVSLSGVQLGEGDSFTMQDIYASQVEYTHTDAAALSDYFTFYVEDPTSGFFGTPAFNIVIDEDAAPQSIVDVLDSDLLSIYPNPATDVLNIEMLDQNSIEQISLFNAQGQLVIDRELDTTLGKIQVNVADLSTGVYLVQARTEKGVVSKKVMID